MKLYVCFAVLLGLFLVPFQVYADKTADQEEPASPEKKVCILLVGDSTVTDHAGWGKGFKCLAGKQVKYLNHAKGGRSSKSYRDEGLWKKALKTKADYVLIQFGHNDQPGKGPKRETDPKTTYRKNMARYVDEARAAGMKPILVTSLTRRKFVDGKVQCSLTEYVNTVRELAKEKKVPLVELYQRSIDQANELGPKGCEKMEPKKNGKFDHTHLNKYGSKMVAGLVVEELCKVVPELDPYFPAK
ncbi:MAG: rhamnogalacturonan acetylesterase [Planctomycetia bacterium]|jgi:pectinesterase